MLVFGTQLHLVTFLIILFELVFFFYQIIYYLSRPSDKNRLRYLILLYLLIQYNLISGLLPDEKIPVSIIIQNILAFSGALIMSMYIPFYFYKSFNLVRLKFHAYYGILLFLLLPFISLFIIPYLITQDLELSRKMVEIVPFFYAIIFLYNLTKALIYKYKNENGLTISKAEIIVIFIAVLFWMNLTVVGFFESNINNYLYPRLNYNNGSQIVEAILTNSGLLIMTILFIRQTINQSREEYNKLLKSEKELKELNASLQEKVRERTKELEDLNEQKTNTFVNLAHETKTPLTLIINSINDHILKYGETEDFKIIKHSIGKLKNDIINFFDLERFNKGFDFYTHEQVSNFSSILKDNILVFKHHCKKKNIVLTEDIEKDVFIKADPIAINRLVNNLITNAIKFTPSNEKICIILKASEGNIQFIVKDEGIGIAPELQSRILEPYFQINNEKSDFQGMGLGLSIVKKIADSLNGEIKINSSPETQKGTSILITLKQYKLTGDELIKDFSIDNELNYDFEILHDTKEIEEGKQSILVVEDNIATLNFLIKKLECKYNVYATTNGAEALKRLNEIRLPDLIISDVMMDKMHGFEFIKIISENKKFNHIPLIFLTAKSTNGDKMEGLRLGAVDYIQKPFIIEEIMGKIEAILDNLANQRRAILEILLANTYKTLVNLNQSEPVKLTVQDFEANCKDYNLTQREIQIVMQLGNGITYKSIGEKLFISEDTVKKHIRNIFDKVQVNNKLDLLKKLQYPNF